MAGDTPPGDPSDLPDPNEWNGYQAIISIVVAQVLATVAVGLRFWARAGILRVAALEDWFILSSLVLSYGIIGTLVVGERILHCFGWSTSLSATAL